MSAFHPLVTVRSRPIADIDRLGDCQHMRRCVIPITLLLTVSGCASVPQEQAQAVCPTNLPAEVSVTVSGNLSSDGIHGIFLRPDACPASYFMLNGTTETVGFERVIAAVYGEERIGTFGKIIRVRVDGSIEGNPLSIRVTRVHSVDLLYPDTNVR